MAQPLWKRLLAVFAKLNIGLLYSVAVALLGIYPTGVENYSTQKPVHERLRWLCLSLPRLEATKMFIT